MSADKSEQAVKMFELVQTYMGVGEETLDRRQLVRIAVELIDISMTCSELRSELYIQLMKQSRNTPNDDYKRQVWELWLIAAATFDPSKVNSL